MEEGPPPADVCMNRIPREQKELEQAFLDRIINLDDYLQDYHKGKHSRIKDIASNLRALIIETRTNKPLLQHLTKYYGMEMIIHRNIPPIIGKKSILSLNELLDELAFASNVPSPVSLTNKELIKVFADQEGAHEDHSNTDELRRLKGDGFILKIGGIVAHERAILGLTSAILTAVKPLKKVILDG